MNKESIPVPQKGYPDELVEGRIISAANKLRKTCETARINPDSTKSVIDLGSGQGFDVEALLTVFSNAQVYAVDYYNLLPSKLTTNERVSFHQGLFTDILASKTISPVDLVLCKFMSSCHGFNDSNINLLVQAIGDNGRLMTCGDNAEMEITGWFRKSFEPVLELSQCDISVWRPTLISQGDALRD
jgi:hypothetical protein